MSAHSQQSVDDAMIERAAVVLAGPARCYCPDDWREDTPSARRLCPEHGEAPWPEDHHRRVVHRVLAAALTRTKENR